MCKTENFISSPAYLMVFVLGRKDLLKVLKSSLASLRNLKLTAAAYIDDLITVAQSFLQYSTKIKNVLV